MQTTFLDYIYAQSNFIHKKFRLSNQKSIGRRPRAPAPPKSQRRKVWPQAPGVSVNYNDKTCSDKDITVRLQIDSEWFNIRRGREVSLNKFITLQFSMITKQTYRPDPKHILEHPDLRKVYPDHKPLLQTWEGETALPKVLDLVMGGGQPGAAHLVEAPDLASLTPTQDLKYMNLEIHCFYSFADIVALMGRRLGQFIADRLLKRKDLHLKDVWLKLPLVIKDGFGVSRMVRLKIVDWFGPDYSSLVKTCLAYNVPIESKHLMESYKTRMHEAYLDPKTHEDMIRYALSDLCLGQLQKAYTSDYEHLCEMIGVRDHLPPPMTKGSKVSRMFILLLDKLCKVPKDFNQIADVASSGRVPSVRHLLREYGVKALLKSDPALTKRHLGIVMGGRIKHEIPHRALWKDALIISMDLQSAYGTALIHMPVPIGHPVLFYYPKHRPEEWPTLGKWLHKWEDELVEHCWYAVIDTLDDVLYFSQNVVYSKYLRNDDNPELNVDAKTSDSFSTDEGHVIGDFMLLESQIKNGILTSTTLSILKNCSSNQEWGELLRKVRIKAGMIFPKSLMIDFTRGGDAPDYTPTKKGSGGVTVREARSKDVKAGAKLQNVLPRYSDVIHHIYPGVSLRQNLMIEDTCGGDDHDYTPIKNGVTAVDHWIESLRDKSLERRITTICELSGHRVEDRRPGPWLRFPLELFIKPLLNHRKAFKKEMKSHNRTSPKYMELDAKQRSVKGVINTLYGILASPHFDTSSPCAANNITAMARGACWLMAASSGGIKSITNGADSELNKVRFWKEKGPCLNTIANLGKPYNIPKRTLKRSIDAPLGSEGNPQNRWILRLSEPPKPPCGQALVPSGPALPPLLEFKGQEYELKEGISTIESLYKAHMFEYFRNCKNPKELDWARLFNIECKVIGKGYAAHGLANYKIGKLWDEEEDILKARGHKLFAPHYDPITGAEVEQSMKVLLNRLFEGKPLKAGVPSMYFKPCSPGEYQARRTLRDKGILPGDSIPKSVRPKLITLSEFSYKTLDSRLSWEQHYNYITSRYGLGLEAAYLDQKGYLHEVEKVKFDIQQRISNMVPPKKLPYHVSTQFRQIQNMLKTLKLWNQTSSDSDSDSD